MSNENMSLGELILALKGCDPTHQVYFDFAMLAPTTFASYRGYYEQLALGWSDSETNPTVAELLERAQQACGETFTGYKGGDYTMGRGTPVWAANYGQSGSTAIVGVESTGWAVILRTAHVE